METVKFTLKRWKLDSFKEKIIAWGNCYGNPEFFKGCYIYTSAIEKAEISEALKRIIVTTHSGNQYALDFAEIDETAYESTKEKAKALGLCLDWQQAQKRTRKQLEEILRPCEMYVKINESLMTEAAYYRTRKNEIVKVAVRCSCGMFTDSVLVEKYDWHSMECFGGWRYLILDWGRRISSYFWNEELEALKVFNEGNDFMIEDFGREILCNKKELTTIKRQETRLLAD